MAEFDEKKEGILQLARERFDTSHTAETENRQDSLASIKFTDGDQWPEAIKREREEEGRPCLTNNKLRKFVKQISGDVRQNRPSMMVSPADDLADVAGAEVRQDILKHIEQRSNANDAYDNAMESALDGGYGYWRIITEFADDSFDQEIRIKKIANRFTVYLDQTAQEYTYEDGRYAFITEKISRKDYEKEFPGKTLVEFDGSSTGEQYENWFEEDFVRIAEYYYKEPVTKKIVQLSTGEVIELKDGLDKDDLEQAGHEIVKERDVKTHKVMWAKISGNDILEGPTEIPSKYIPIVPVLGNEINIEGKRKFRSLIYDAMDPMRMYNYWRTHATETIALAPKAPFILTPEQIENHEQMWKQANTKNMPYLLANNVPGHGRPERQRQVEVPAAVVNEAANASADISDTIGRYEASRGEASNERSGRAILARKEGADDTTYTFVDNYYKSITYSTKICLDMMPRVMDTERVIRLRGQDGKESVLELNMVMMDFDELEPVTVNDLTIGKYDIVPDAGASYQTKRQRIAAAMLDFVQFYPDAAVVIGPRLADMQDWPQAQEIAEELRALASGVAGGEGGELPFEEPLPEGA